jgi:uncharacterized membrane protein YdbT with pleckstrin-like domain
VPYPKSLLNDRETVALDLHPHWWHFAVPAGVLTAALALGIVIRVMSDGDVERALTWAAIVLILGSALWLVKRYTQWATTNFVITSDRIIFRTGVIAKHGIEIPLERVNNVLFSQSVLERLVGAGDILIESGGETGQQRFTDIKHPDQVQKLIHVQRESNAVRMYGGGGASATDVVTQLEKLEGMLHRGTISQDEFDRQKRRLLGSP